MQSGMKAMQDVMMIFPAERPIFLREVTNNMYSVGPYFMGKIIAGLPIAILIPVSFGTIVYYIVGLNNVYWWKFPVYLSINILIYNGMAGYCYVLTSIFTDESLILNMMTLFIIPLMLFSGFFISLDRIPTYLQPIGNISVYKYGYEALYLNEFSDYTSDDLSCIDDVPPCDPIGDLGAE